MATIFNINPTHVKYVQTLLKQKDIVIIHGDGAIFASNNDEIYGPYVDDETGQLVTKVNAVYGSNHHKIFNSGYKETEATARGGYRAIYKRGDGPPQSVEDIEKAFYLQANRDLVESTTAKPVIYSNVFSIDEPIQTPESKKGRPPKTDKTE